MIRFIGAATMRVADEIGGIVMMTWQVIRALFPPKIAPGVIDALKAAGVEARYFELDSDLGHSSSGPEHTKWSPVLREFLAPLYDRLG